MSTSNIGQFPQVRLRRSRRTAALRTLVAETGLGPTDLIYPVFVLDGQKRTQAVPSMPGIERKSVDVLLKELRDHVANSIGPIAKPASIVFTPDVPKTRSGKIMRRLLRDISEQRQLGDVTTLANADIVSEIAEMAAATTSED